MREGSKMDISQHLMKKEMQNENKNKRAIRRTV